MSRRFWFGLLSLVGALAMMLFAPTRAADGPKFVSAKLVKVYVCPISIALDLGTVRFFYAHKCKTFPEPVGLMLGANDPYPGYCSDPAKVNCIEIDEEKGYTKKKTNFTPTKPRHSADIFPPAKDGFTVKELPDSSALAYLETSKDGKSKVKVMLYKAEVIPPPKVGAKVTFGVGLEVVTDDEPTLTLRHAAIAGKDLDHKVANVYAVRYGKEFTYTVTLGAKTEVETVKKKKK